MYLPDKCLAHAVCFHSRLSLAIHCVLQQTETTSTRILTWLHRLNTSATLPLSPLHKSAFLGVVLRLLAESAQLRGRVGLSSLVPEVRPLIFPSMFPYNHHAYDRRYAVPPSHKRSPRFEGSENTLSQGQHAGQYNPNFTSGQFEQQGGFYSVPYTRSSLTEFYFPRGGDGGQGNAGSLRQAFYNRHSTSGRDVNQNHRQSAADNNLKRKASNSGSDAEVGHPHSKKRKGRQGETGSPHISSPSPSMPTSSGSSSQPAGRIVYNVPGDGCERITEAIVEYYNEYRQSEADLRHKIMLSNCLFAIVKNVFPGCRLFIVGSSLSGFGTRTSDMDLCLLVSQQLQIDQRHEAVHILNAIHKALRCCTFVKSSQVIRAKVPILKFTDAKKNIECDLNINNGVGIRNTHLLKYYCMMDPRVGALMLFIKFWARFHDINDAHKRTISSYSFALMLIHYLQVCNPPVLPCLQKLYPHQFNSRTDLRTLRLDEPLQDYMTKNTASLGKLFLGFLEYYAYRFRPSQDVISVREGGVIPRHRVRGGSTDPAQWKWLCIEEPFDLSNTARSVFDPNIFSRVMHVFEHSARTLKETGDVKSVLSRPF